jgi:hypothetical protein
MEAIVPSGITRQSAAAITQGFLADRRLLGNHPKNGLGEDQGMKDDLLEADLSLADHT